MRVKVPRDLAGGSLLNAHRWVKSTVARQNPGGSTDNYKIQGTDGTPLSLSDLTSRTFDEVLVISGTRSNPGHERGMLSERAAERGFIDAETSAYPVASPDWRYPSYTGNNRIGNNIAQLLPKDIDTSMLNRLAAQNGMFSALNTTTKLLYTDEGNFGDSATDPKIAALLQTYANAQRTLQHPVLPNPARTFFGPDMNEGYRGVLSPDEAIKMWAGNKFQISGGLDNKQSTQLMDRARIVRMYDLDNPDNITNFIDDVLTPYLVTSTANANLLKAMRHGDYWETTEKTLGRFKGDYTRTPQWKKLLAMLPMHANCFYEGKDYALIAHPIFQRQSLAIQAMDKKLIKRIMKIVKEHPDNVDDAISPGQVRSVIQGSGIQGLIDRLLVPEKRELNRLLIAQEKVLATTEPAEHLSLLRELYLGDRRDANIASSVKDMTATTKVTYQRDVAGFRPTPPPYWPKAVVLAVMDTLKENIHAFLEKTDRFGLAFKQLASIPHVSLDKSKDIIFKLGKEQARISVESLMNLRAVLSQYTAAKIFEEDKLGKKENRIEAPHRTEIIFKSNDHRLFKGRSADKPKYWQDIRFILAAHTNDPEFFKEKQRWDPANANKMKKRGLVAQDNDEIMSVFDQMIHQYSRTEYQDLSDDTLNMLSIFIEVEDTARNKYNYAMSENDRAFVLYLLESIFDMVRSEAAIMTESDNGPGGRSDAEIVNVLRHMQRPDSTLDGDQLNNRLHINRMIRSMSDDFIADWRAEGDLIPRPSEVHERFDELDREFENNEYARSVVATERARVLEVVDQERTSFDVWNEQAAMQRARREGQTGDPDQMTLDQWMEE